MVAWIGITPPVTKRNGGRGSSSKLVRLIVASTVFVRGSITEIVFESSLAMNTRSSAWTASAGGGVWADATRVDAAATAAAADFRRVLRVNVIDTSAGRVT